MPPASKATAKKSKKTSTALWNRPGFLIRRLHQIHCALFAEETPDANITPVQYSLLSTLQEHGELDQNSLSHRIGLERTSVAEVLPRLEDRKLIERKRSELDGRIRLVALTTEGQTLLDAMSAAVARAHARTVEALSPAERKELIRMMTLLVQADTSERAPLLKQR
ncbi:winged helix-turn-helix transcriptional regulator [Lampropedia puyangensis]|uniref:Winged helix-turn-helix transcriptional regulator n=2 Tax=Lampropedia puyangensis TaxID=1330072 RepID=A0A4S8F9A7_9BURK|nr:winged helix-turn-helix transcriptional regulator [Lampropedia puyangensis]